MTHATCENHREQMVAFVRAELPSLEQQRIETHLSHCAGCAGLHTELKTAFAATADWQPEMPAGVNRLRGSDCA